MDITDIAGPGRSQDGGGWCGSPRRWQQCCVVGGSRRATRRESPQTNGICERFRQTLRDEFDRVAFRKEVYRTMEDLQTDLDEWMRHCNAARTRQGRWCFGKTPMQTLRDDRPIARERQDIGEAA